jgi:ribonuclease R
LINILIKERKERILAYMQEAAYKPLLFEELVMVLVVPKTDVELFRNVIEELEDEGKVIRTHRNRYGVPERMNLIAGTLQGSERGFGFVIPDDENTSDIFIPAEGLNGAMNKDRVLARTNRKVIGEKKAEGEIVKIVKRANTIIVGTFESSRNFGFVTPDDQKISGDIFIPKDEFYGAKTGQKVVAEIVKWPEKRRNAEGKIIEIIGDKDEPGADIRSIIRSYNLSEDFPQPVLSQAEAISDVVTGEMDEGRRDLRQLKMVTIDGEDAKDLDDAVSLEKLPDGNYRLGVHIADVSHYVTEKSPLDIEALKRGTSVYLVDRVIPMLPKKLSNGICSLNPKVDRLAFTVMMDINPSGKVVRHEIFESLININERMTYTNVYKILAEDDSALKERYSYLLDDFRMMEELAIILRNKRVTRGAIDFDFEEARIVLDEKGKPIEIKKYEITIANKIIEEFMLACNETVAEHFYWANSPFVYRIHGEPDSEKIENLAEFVQNMGYHLKGINKIHPKALQELLEKVKGKKEERIISTVVLRSLQKARYSHLNDGHFGLAAKFYCHFTSPIRRYPDLIIHRIMKEYLKGKLNENREQALNDALPEVARDCSERERAADEAERETEDLKKVEFMKEHEGDVFKGIISTVTSFGMFVELDNTIEGLIRMSSLEDDYYIFNDKLYCLVGERTRKTYRIGDELNVKLVRADLASRQIDFIIADEKERQTGEERNVQTHVHADRKSGRTKKDVDKKVLRNIAGRKPRKKSKGRAGKGAR